ncbi:MAG: hypothetical protein HKN35_00590 [Woeseia sp.]|nr:hypothetical protein [Woeseia sp.]
MRTKTIIGKLGLILLLGAATACQEKAQAPAIDATATTVTPADSSAVSPGKPSAPIAIEYQVLGTPMVGQPVAVEIRVVSEQPGQTMRLSYFIDDTDSLMFADAQPESIAIEIPGDAAFAARQVRLVPQREGRVYFNVTAEVQTANGMMLKSLAVPIAVGSSAVTLELNGELQETADGESVISMPAREN